MIAPPPVVGRRGTVLLYLGIVDLLIALSLIKPAPQGLRTPSAHFLAELMPLPWWGALWLAVGLVCLGGAFVHRLDRISYTLAVALKTLWGVVIGLGWVAGCIERGWVQAVIWIGLAMLVAMIAGWPEPAPTLTSRRR